MTFRTEADLCAAFIKLLPAEWIAYPETAGWDILLVHRHGGWQIGVEAKLALNAKVLAQAIDHQGRDDVGPDFRAVLVDRVTDAIVPLAERLGLTVIRVEHGSYQKSRINPALPKLEGKAAVTSNLNRQFYNWIHQPAWHDHFPTQREKLPEYVPEVAAGVPSPIILSEWKIKAMRVCVYLDRHGKITRAVFRALGIDPGRWMNGHWLKMGEGRGEWVPGRSFPGPKMRADFPNLYARIEADYEKWAGEAKLLPPGGANA